MENASGAPAPAAARQGRTGNPLVAGEPAGRRPATPGKRSWTVVAGVMAAGPIPPAPIGWQSGRLFGTGEPPGLAFTLPAGAKHRIARPTIDSAIEIPTRIRFAAGEPDAIAVRNLDDIAHRAGPFLVEAYQTYTRRFPDPGEYPMPVASTRWSRSW